MNMTKELRASAKNRLQELYGFRRELLNGATDTGGAWYSVKTQIQYLEKFITIPLGARYC